MDLQSALDSPAFQALPPLPAVLHWFRTRSGTPLSTTHPPPVDNTPITGHVISSLHQTPSPSTPFSPAPVQTHTPAPTFASAPTATQPPPPAPSQVHRKHGIDLNLQCKCGVNMVSRTCARGQAQNLGRCFFSCPNKDMRKDKGDPNNGCKSFVWADEIIHSLCSTARQMQQFQINSMNKLDPNLSKTIYPDGIPFLYPEDPHFPSNSFPNRASSASLSDILSSR
ncbi:hypothetical protein CYMTET_31136 [Cymbomonas tetramitiformis]|uniref:GRF-type domain-containing protein n=1 Tax=Cymbomonas tetramitiformis TaxID=36881 RepID=A0AAE0FHE4_9CHLO|nr:hypothetical protein CYMTET_31136 [Cymbomonas tetramitiformis]